MIICRKCCLGNIKISNKFYNQRCRTVVLNLGSIEPLGIDGVVSGFNKGQLKHDKAWLYHSKLTIVTFV